MRQDRKQLNIEFDDGRYGADFSEDRIYRYLLWRRWDNSKHAIGFIGLNPSTADEMTDDNTVRRCITFAKRWGAGGMLMMNIFAFRATDPSQMLNYQAPIGSMNDKVILDNVEKCEFVVCAWGNHGEHLYRSTEVLRLLIDGGFESKLRCFSITNKRQPRHPLYVRGDDQIYKLPITVVNVKYITNVIYFTNNNMFVIYDSRGPWRGNGKLSNSGNLEKLNYYLPGFDENVRIELVEAIKERVVTFAKKKNTSNEYNLETKKRHQG